VHRDLPRRNDGDIRKADEKEESTVPQRYDLITNYRCGSSIEEMEESDDGVWVRYEDVRVGGFAPQDLHVAFNMATRRLALAEVPSCGGDDCDICKHVALALGI
jgi:hypothetical protein